MVNLVGRERSSNISDRRREKPPTKVSPPELTLTDIPGLFYSRAYDRRSDKEAASDPLTAMRATNVPPPFDKFPDSGRLDASAAPREKIDYSITPRLPMPPLGIMQEMMGLPLEVRRTPTSQPYTTNGDTITGSGGNDTLRGGADGDPLGYRAPDVDTVMAEHLRWMYGPNLENAPRMVNWKGRERSSNIDYRVNPLAPPRPSSADFLGKSLGLGKPTMEEYDALNAAVAEWDAKYKPNVQSSPENAALLAAWRERVANSGPAKKLTGGPGVGYVDPKHYGPGEAEAAGYYVPPNMGSGTSKGGVDKRVIDTIIAEALGEGDAGMTAVAYTILNRANNRNLTPLQVVKQKSQYSGYSNPGSAVQSAMNNPQVRARVEALWNNVQTGAVPDPTQGGEYFHTTSISPGWAKGVNRNGKTTLGNHVFYLGKGQTNAVSPEVPGRRPADTATAAIARLIGADPGVSGLGYAPIPKALPAPAPVAASIAPRGPDNRGRLPALPKPPVLDERMVRQYAENYVPTNQRISPPSLSPPPRSVQTVPIDPTTGSVAPRFDPVVDPLAAPRSTNWFANLPSSASLPPLPSPNRRELSLASAATSDPVDDRRVLDRQNPLNQQFVYGKQYADQSAGHWGFPVEGLSQLAAPSSDIPPLPISAPKEPWTSTVAGRPTVPVGGMPGAPRLPGDVQVAQNLPPAFPPGYNSAFPFGYPDPNRLTPGKPLEPKVAFGPPMPPLPTPPPKSLIDKYVSGARLASMGGVLPPDTMAGWLPASVKRQQQQEAIQTANAFGYADADGKTRLPKPGGLMSQLFDMVNSPGHRFVEDMNNGKRPVASFLARMFLPHEGFGQIATARSVTQPGNRPVSTHDGRTSYANSDDGLTEILRLLGYR